MYAIPIVLLLVLLAIGALVWSPLFAVVAVVVVFVAFLAYAGPRPKADKKG